jgi:hypothetical protein
MVAGEEDSKCPKCGALQTNRLVSRFARYRNEDDRIDEIADRLEMMGEPDSAAGMREIVRDLGKAMDEDVSDEIEELFEADMAGELADDE